MLKLQIFDDTGVSESLGYILVFAIVLTGIAGIVFFGVTMLNDAKDRNNFQNVEQGLTVVQSDMKRVAMEKAPLKASKLRVEGGTLVMDFNASSIRVDFAGHTYDNYTGDISFDSSKDGKMLSIENGGLWKTYGEPMNELGIVPPRIFASTANNAIVINVIRLKGNDTAFGGVGTISLNMAYVSNNVYTYESAVPADVTIKVNTTYATAWARCLQDTIQMFPVTTDNVTDSSMQMTISDVSEVIICEHTIYVEPIIFYG